MATTPRHVVTLRPVKTMVFGDAAYSISRPVTKEPSASPPVRQTLPSATPTLLRLGGATSARAAVKAVVAMPVAKPCTTRPAITQSTLGATRNTTDDMR